MTDFATIVAEIETLQEKLEVISDGLADMKTKAEAGQKIDAEELGVVVSEISELDRLMRAKCSAGH